MEQQKKFFKIVLTISLISIYLADSSEFTRAAKRFASKLSNQKLSKVEVNLINVDEFSFNNGNTDVRIMASFPIFNINNYAIFANGQPIMNTSHTKDSIIVREKFDTSTVLSVYALDIYNVPIFTSFHLYFGLIMIPIRVLFNNGTVASNVIVNLNLTENPHVGHIGTTNNHGIVIFKNVPTLPISIFVRTKQHQIDVVGMIPSISPIDLILLPDSSRTETMIVNQPTCDECNKDCTKCPSDPMCRQSCINPPMHSCAFYSDCMEEKVSCGANGYALGYGMKYCMKFTHNLKTFSPRGQRWIGKTMNCLQKSLVSPLENCEKNCSILQKIAFNSHPRCYVKGGVCELPVFDWITIASIVGKDLFTADGLIQALKTLPQCIPNILERISLVLLEESLPIPTRIALMILQTWLRSL
ncbi:hypothetical protein I4U23_015419 [Adineta vaga]|nr:hypothetical protein I4U23_015419 [Adineta vaga]